MAEYLKRELSKEIPHSNNPPQLQKMVQEGKAAEWQTCCPNRMPSRFITAKSLRQSVVTRLIASLVVALFSHVNLKTKAKKLTVMTCPRLL
jgi:hypothetical protein